MSCEAGPSSGRGWGLSSTTYLHSLTPSPVLSKYILSEGMKECKACNSKACKAGTSILSSL